MMAGMRPYVVLLAIWVHPLAGCSLIYNPNNLPPAPGDAEREPDAELILDADPSQLELERVAPNLVFEGTGTGGSRSALITVHGKQIVSGAKVSFAVHGGGAVTMIAVDDAHTEVAADGRMVAAPITIAVDPSLGDGQSVQIDVTVTQPTGSGDVARTLTELAQPAGAAVLVVQGLDELNAVDRALTTAAAHEFSQVSITGALTALDTTNPLIIRARGSITITGSAKVNAAGTTKGAGGNAGGTGGGILGNGTAGSGPGAGQPNSGGGGFATAGGGGVLGGTSSGDAQITTLGLPNRSSGGAGAAGGAISSGGDGGAGGGSIEISAGGTISLAVVEAKGGTGQPGANDGGGGSGGVVLVRSGVSVAATAVNVNGGTGLNAGSIGRIRIDAPGSVATTTPTAYRGPMFASATELITRQDDLVVTVVGQADRPIKYKIFNEDRTLVKGPFDQSIASGGSNSFTLEEPLFRGLNTLCLQVENGDIANETRNCIDIVYLFAVR